MIEPPADVPEYAYPAWASCLMWAVNKPEIIAAFEAETGKHYTLPKAPIEQMIDEATGIQSEYFHAFGEWFNKNVWGAWESNEENPN